jgi:hypothetical protein
MSPDLVKSAIEAAGGNAAVAEALNVSTEGVRLWGVRGLPDDRVLRLAEFTGWVYTPHQLAPHLYPHPDDGLPTALRKLAPTRRVSA